MLHAISKIVSSLAVVVVGLGSGYFGTAAYYEKNPQSVAQSGEISGHQNTIGWELKDSLLAITPWENWRAWSNREKVVRQALVNDSPSSQEFKDLKTAFTSGGSESSTKKTCASIYSKLTTDAKKSELEKDVKKYCSLTFNPTTTPSP